MLQAQVNFWSLQESKRHNLTAEQLEQQNIAEMQRSHRASEQIAWNQNAEAKRHNVISEQQSATDVDTRRLNVLVNAASQREQARHNLAEESIGYSNARTNRMNAQTNRYSAETGAEIGFQNASSNARQASASASQAATAQRRLSIEQQEADTRQFTAKMNQWNRTAEIAISGVSTAANLGQMAARRQAYLAED